MLVISLKTEETLRIGRDITVKILKSNSGLVRVGIEAPTSLKIERESLSNKANLAKIEKSENKS